MPEETNEIDYKKGLESLEAKIDASIKEHNKYGTLDGWIYNGSTIVAIILSSVASFFADELEGYLKLLTGVTAIIIALDRSLNWGKRWLFHRQMKNEYLIIKAKISFYQGMPEGLKAEDDFEAYKDIYNHTYRVRLQEVKMPGVGEIKVSNPKES